MQQVLDDVKKCLEDGFYFSYGYDLTASRQRRINWMQEKNTDPLKLIACDHQYFWNLALYRDFIWQKVDCRWFAPLIQGYFKQTSGVLGGIPVQLTLLSRRKWNGAGTRYNARGINDQGYVANFCETEQILVVNNRFLISHVQIRGSVPVFWEQRGLAEDVNLTRNPEMTKKPFQTHFKRIVDSYGPCQVINLLRYNVPREVRLTTEYVRQVHESPYKNKIKFLNFDFHGFCGGDRYQALKVMIQRVDTEILKQGYLIEHLA